MGRVQRKEKKLVVGANKGRKAAPKLSQRQLNASGSLKKSRQKVKHQLLLSKLHEQQQAKQAKHTMDLSALQGALPVDSKARLLHAVDAARQEPRSKVLADCIRTVQTGKQHRRLLMQESEQIKSVLTHPAFVAQPLSTVKEHLKNMVELQKKAAATAAAAVTAKR